MLRPIGMAACLVLTVSGCSRLAGSPVNPMNWFNKDREAPVATAPTATQPLVPTKRDVIGVDSRDLIAQVISAEIAQTPSGAILRATGVAPTQGYFNAELVLESIQNRTATYAFRVERPARFEIEGTTASRTITAATVLSAGDLAGIRTVIVKGAGNTVTARR